jgi:holliday junction DNA helicase RuvA
MLGSLTGTVTAHLATRILVQVGGVGYWVFTGSWQPSLNETVTAYLHHAVREDASDLYGFAELQQLELFEQLITISGIGPKAALSILSLGTSDRITTAIASSDIAFLSLAQGIGKKAAEKIVLELKNKVTPGLTPTALPPTMQEDLLDSLVALGYKPHEVRAMVADLPSDLTTTESQLRWVLSKRS